MLISSFLLLTDESGVRFEARSAILSHTAGGGQTRGLAVELEISQSGPDAHKIGRAHV